MTGPEILRAMENGSTLYSGRFGFWLMDVFNTRCTNVHHGAAKSLVRRKLIERVNDDQWCLPSESQRKAAESADEKPDGQAENVNMEAPNA